MNEYPELPASSFPDFFRSHTDGRNPFQWQIRLAEQVCRGEWPRYLKLPTSSGKTSCLDIAVFALAHQAWRQHATKQPVDTPRRIFFVVDRRIIVNEAYRRSRRLADHLSQAINLPHSPAYPVAFWLRYLTGTQNAPPLDCFELRGGIYRDDAWVRSLLQPTIVTSTVDQVGSRLLFRGYGVSDRNLPIHAALTANDSLILLDEAHCSVPFSQTMEAIARYRDVNLPPGVTGRWAEQTIATPFQFLEMTATPQSEADPKTVFQLQPEDYQVDSILDRRHGCQKPVRLEISSAKGASQNVVLAKHLVDHAESLANGNDANPRCLRIAIVVNRVACAREVFAILQSRYPERVELMIGRMRPIDRDQLTPILQQRFQSDSPTTLSEPHFVVATQCLEVGADFDFDGMVTQCASLDALRQRFGRLNRLGNSDHARGVIVMATGDVAPRKVDPIYDSALPETWKWLQQHAHDSSFDFGVRSLDRLINSVSNQNSAMLEKLSPPPINAPVLMPAHLDLLCQTAPRPALEPNVAAFLHGPNRGQPEVRICWRADLPEFRSGQESEWLRECFTTLSVCPPASSECLSVPLKEFKAWLLGDDCDDSGDMLNGVEDESEVDFSSADRTKTSARSRADQRQGVTWNGHECASVSGATKGFSALVPNSLVVLPARAGGWTWLGHIPNPPSEPDSDTDSLTPQQLLEIAKIDVASEAYLQSRDRLILRVHPALMSSESDVSVLRDLLKKLKLDDSWKLSDLKAPPPDVDNTPELDVNSLTRRALQLQETRQRLAAAAAVSIVAYPGGIVAVGPRLQSQRLPRANYDDDFDEHNVDADYRISLADHLAHVAAETHRLVTATGTKPHHSSALIAAAERHDLGKADLRFQAMLLGSSINLAAMQPRIWAKSARGEASRSLNLNRSSPRSDSDQLPRGFRHEMLSLELSEFFEDDLDDESRNLMLHVIAAHHGHARPFAPIVIDQNPSAIDLGKIFSTSSGLENSTAEDDLPRIPAHRLDSGITERFWKLTKCFGWWGLAWFETIVRLADWVASAAPAQEKSQLDLRRAHRELTTPKVDFELPLAGIPGTNPLGFLVAVGLLRTLSAAIPNCHVRMKWKRSGTWFPILVLNQMLTQDDLIKVLHDSLTNRQGEDHFVKLGKNINVSQETFRQIILNSLATSNSTNRTSIDFFAAFGSDAMVSLTDETTIQDTALRTMAGAGHQHFLETMRNLISACNPNHLEKALFQTWKYDDPTQTLSLRFDPADDNRYALRWRNPSGDPDRKSAGSMLAANRLAIEAIPLFITAPGEKRLQTAAFKGHRSDDTTMNWPLWSVPLPLSVVQSLLVSGELLETSPESEMLRHRGVSMIVCSRRITVGKVRNFTSAQPRWAVSSTFD